ncbi:MAG: copper chaperone PCu(A)C [Holophaga sp.]|nr:copper chaperone PCu(A)C [Holophaga sp.]
MEASSGMDGMGGSTSAAYMVIQNPGTEPDNLIDVRSDAAEIVELHTSQTKNGVTMMSAVESVPVPARGKAELKPGGLHIMFIKLKNDLAAGDKISLTLVFEKSGEIQVEAEVKNP